MSNQPSELTIDQILAKAAGIKNFECREGGASEFEIVELEKSLSINLSDDYRYFLANYGFAVWFGDCIEGLAKEGTIDHDMTHVLKTTLSYQEKYSSPEYQSLPNHGVVINRYDGGGCYFLFSKESERAGEVGLFLTETYGREAEKFNSFTDFLLHLLVRKCPELKPYDKGPSLVEVDYSFLDNTK